MKWKKILTGTLAAAMLFSNASVANRNVMAKETAVVSLESARETLGTLMNEAIEKVNIEKDGIKYSQASKDAVMVKLLRVEDLHLWMKLYAKNHYGYNIQEPLYKMRDDRNAYSRRKFKYRINESYIKILTIKTFHFSWRYIVYALRPIIVGLLPNFLYDKLHKWSLKREEI